MEPDWEFQELVQIYENIGVVNKSMSQRLRNASKEDASVNALVHLHAFAQMLPYSIEDALIEIEYLFTGL